MKYIRSPKLFFIGLFVMVLLVNVITAYFSVGYYHTDEHVHILGFMNYKLGQNPQNNLPIEFFLQMRSWMLPGFYFVSFLSFFLI